jgi:hypothetical protein
LAKAPYRQLIIAGPATDHVVQLLRQFCCRHNLFLNEAEGMLRPGAALQLRQTGGPTISASWTEEALQQIKLPEAMGLLADKVAAYRAVLQLSGVETAADLSRMTLEAWLQPEDITLRTPFATRVIKFMILRDIPFLDLNPAQIFITPIEIDGQLIDVRTHNCLMREGLEWAEILPFFSGETLVGGMRNFGSKSLERIEMFLSQRGLSLLPSLGQ